MYVRVYAPDGEPFDVSRDRADRLLLDHGWTQTPPTFEETAPEKSSTEYAVEYDFYATPDDS